MGERCRTAVIIALWAWGAAYPSARAEEPATQATPATPIPDHIAQLFETHCLDCHRTEDPSGGVDLSQSKTLDEVYHQGRMWNKVGRVLHDHTMPPKTADPIADADRQTLAQWVETTLQAVDCTHQTEPGKVTIRRLNRVEYRNTIRDLLGVDIDASRDLPADAAGNGFDNQGDTLFIPPVLMEKYVDATKRIVEATFTRPESRTNLLRSIPSETVTVPEAARKNLEVLLLRGFRRPPLPEEIDRRVGLVEQSIVRGETFEAGMKSALESVLLSPHFLFRIEQNRAPEGSSESYRISDFELATRLSYWLWSTMPDQELFDFAAQGTLGTRDVLKVQVERLLHDPRSIALSQDFAAQWFGFRDMRTHEMDLRRFGNFNGVREHMYAESIAFFDHLFRENASILDVVDSPYAFLNAPLAGHYGIPGVDGETLRKVALVDRRRGGVLGMGSTLVVTSYPTRTSPVMRGKWVLEQLLGTPPPPPPPNVKPVTREDTVKDGMTLRQRLEKHREVESCASCHAKMDPIGFGLENFDGVGQWRDQDNGLAIDASATLPDGTAVRGPEGLKDALLARKDLFIRQTIEKMLVYALGRGLDYYDECSIRATRKALEDDGYRSHGLIHAIAESYPFQHRRNSE